MKAYLEKFMQALSESVGMELGATTEQPEASQQGDKQSFLESIEDNFLAVAYAEAADYDEIRRAAGRDSVVELRPDDCGIGDNDLCFVEA